MHTVKSFEEELRTLESKIAQMGGLAEQAVVQAMDAMGRRDPVLAEATLTGDKHIDELERTVEEMAMSIIARRQPMAVDLREIITALRISTELERIGDLAKNISKRALAIATEQQPKPLIIGFMHMGETALQQLKDVLDAYSNRDSSQALHVWSRDNQIDAMYNSLFRELLTYMMEDPRNISVCTHLLFGAKNIERIGDHTTNIAETLYFLIHGTPITDERPKGDITSYTVIMPESEPNGETRQ